MSDAGMLLGRLLAVPQDGAVEDCGATAVFGQIAGTQISAVTRSRRSCRLTAPQQARLHVGGIAAGHERRGILYAGPDVPVAATTAVLVPARIPARVRAMLGVGPDGEVCPAEADMPLGRALAGYGARREPLEARLASGLPGGTGQVVIVSAARLWLGPVPVALVSEHVLAGFLAAFPGPWDAP